MSSTTRSGCSPPAVHCSYPRGTRSDTAEDERGRVSLQWCATCDSTCIHVGELMCGSFFRRSRLIRGRDGASCRNQSRGTMHIALGRLGPDSFRLSPSRRANDLKYVSEREAEFWSLNDPAKHVSPERDRGCLRTVWRFCLHNSRTSSSTCPDSWVSRFEDPCEDRNTQSSSRFSSQDNVVLKGIQHAGRPGMVGSSA